MAADDPSATRDEQRVFQLFEAACEMPTDERETWLDRECPDATVREQVGELLREFDSSMDLGSSEVSIAPSSAVPERVGPYRILDTLGRGGMGVVYLAEQSRPRRRVALKVVNSELWSEAAIRRFDREAELLGQLQHAGIAQIHEFSTEGEGAATRAYIVMEYVDGLSITEACRHSKAGLHERIELLTALCEAVDHAHQRGILHRDLKPGNVLVDAQGQVKVIDFGIARSLDREHTLQTNPGDLVGTLAFMSPEQFSGDRDRVDARSDVYSLGVLAFELLAERRPFDLSHQSLVEAARIVSEEAPPRLGQLRSEARGDLEIVIGKALEKEPERRYPSALAFAQDLRRVLEHEAIEARPASAIYQLRRVARRHRAAFAGLAAGLLAIVVGAGIAVHFALRNARLATLEAEARAEADQKAEEALELARVVQERSDEVTRRADPGRMLIATRQADELWPAVPDQVAAMDSWLERHAEPLKQSRGQHLRFLEELRREAMPYTEEERRLDRESNPARMLHAGLEQQYAAVEAQLMGEAEAGTLTENQREFLERDLEELEAEMAEAESRFEQRLRWTFEDRALQEQHDHLFSLVVDLTVFLDDPQGPYQSVLERRERALGLEERSRSGSEARAEWEAFQEDLRELAVYQGLELSPQLGLRPLRRDPTSGLWEFWHVQSGLRPRANPDPDALNPWILDRDTGLVFVLVPGSPPLFVSKYEVTQGQWERWSGQQPSMYSVRFCWYSEDRTEVLSENTWWNPVERITYIEAERELARLDLRLPSRPELESATRAGTPWAWWTGPRPESLQGAANLADARTKAQGGPFGWRYEEGLEDDWVVHAPVGSFRANPHGLHDTLGNVWEWTSTGDDELRESVGGAFDCPAELSRAPIRNVRAIEYSAENLGARPVRSVREPDGEG